MSVTRNCFFRDRSRVSSFFEVLYVDGLLKLGFRAWDLPPREDVGSGSAPPARPYIPFEGRTTTQDSYVPKMLSDDGPTFGSRSGTGDGAPAARPYIPFEGRSTAQDAYKPKLVPEAAPTFGARTGSAPPPVPDFRETR